MKLRPAPKPKGKRPVPRALSHARRIADRCFPWKYGDAYVSALLAIRGEVPSQGRANKLPDRNLNREHFFASAIELRIGAWVLYVPSLLEMLTNRPLSPVDGVAILDGHPMLAGRILPASSGTVLLAHALRIAHPLTTDDRDPETIAASGEECDYWPLTTDILVLIRDGDGVRAVNLFIKKRHGDIPVKGRELQLLRLNRLYYAEGNIPTYVVTEDDLHPVVTNNLVRAARLGLLPESIPIEYLASALLYMEERVHHSAPNTWSRTLFEQFGLLPEDCLALFHYGVFSRRLRVDLTQPVSMDLRHRPERVNHAAEFADRYLEPLS